MDQVVTSIDEKLKFIEIKHSIEFFNEKISRCILQVFVAPVIFDKS